VACHLFNSGVAVVGGVGVAEGACPLDVAVWEDLVGPSVFVFADVVVAAERGKVADVGSVAVGPFDTVIDVALRELRISEGVRAGEATGSNTS